MRRKTSSPSIPRMRKSTSARPARFVSKSVNTFSPDSAATGSWPRSRIVSARLDRKAASSSAIRIFAIAKQSSRPNELSFRGFILRQFDNKARAAVLTGLRAQRPAVRLDDFARNAQTKSDAFCTRGGKRLEKFFVHLVSDTRAGVLD